jgi:RNA polymerase sigma factor (sigma-70 family)
MAKKTSNGDGLRIRYIDEITQTPLLTADEEVELIDRINQGRQARAELAEGGWDEIRKQSLLTVIEDGEAARERLLMANTRLVVSVAKKYTGRGVPFLDLIHEGIIGLMRATKKFEVERGNRFSTYATWWIRQAITRAIDNHGRTIRLPVHKNVEINKLNYATRFLAQEMAAIRPMKSWPTISMFRPNRLETHSGSPKPRSRWNFPRMMTTKGGFWRICYPTPTRLSPRTWLRLKSRMSRSGR